MSEYRLSSAAISDIREIRQYSKQRFGVAATASYIHGLEATLDMLATRPSAGKNESKLGYDGRSFRYKSHRIYFRVAAPMIEVLRILHHARDAFNTYDQQQ